MVSERSFSQINFSFSAAKSTYQPIVSGKTANLNPFFSTGISATDEGFANNIPIGFNFLYNYNQSVSTVNICSNGFVVLGTGFLDGTVSSQDGYYVNDLMEGPCSYSPSTGLVKSGHQNQRSVIAPFWGDLDVQQNSNMVYQTTGTAPNRVFTIEWKNFKWDYQCIAAIGSVELKLYETTNVIEFAYSNMNGTPTSSAKASIGLTTNATGCGSFISLQDNSAIPAFSKFLENNNITAFPASNLVYRFTPHAAFTKNLGISQLYHSGTICKNGESYTFSANVFNLGTQTTGSVPVTLKVAGNNSFSSTQYLDNLAPGKSTTVVFNVFLPQIISTDTLSVSVPNDNDNSDNLLEKKIQITNNLVSNVSLEDNSYQYNGIGNNVPSEFATLFSTVYYKSINQISLYFSNECNNAPFDITVYAADGINNNPGTILWQQTGLTGNPGINYVNITPGVTVQGAYFIAVTQSTATSISYAYEAESPLQANTYFYRTPLNSNWIDIASEGNKYKLLMGVQYDNTLPVTATKFNGYKISAKNVLKWTTYTEINNDHFVVERSTNGHDFTAIGTLNTLAPSGNSSSALNYSFTDNNTLPVNSYYRIRQVDKLSNYAFSDVVMLIGDGKIPYTLNNIFPNPVESILKLSYSSPVAGNNTITLYDITGRIVKQIGINSVLGDNQQQINLAEINSGQYFMQLLNGSGKSNTIKLIKK